MCCAITDSDRSHLLCDCSQSLGIASGQRERKCGVFVTSSEGPKALGVTVESGLSPREADAFEDMAVSRPVVAPVLVNTPTQSASVSTDAHTSSEKLISSVPVCLGPLPFPSSLPPSLDPPVGSALPIVGNVQEQVQENPAGTPTEVMCPPPLPLEPSCPLATSLTPLSEPSNNTSSGTKSSTCGNPTSSSPEACEPEPSQQPEESVCSSLGPSSCPTASSSPPECVPRNRFSEVSSQKDVGNLQDLEEDWIKVEHRSMKEMRFDGDSESMHVMHRKNTSTPIREPSKFEKRRDKLRCTNKRSK